MERALITDAVYLLQTSCDYNLPQEQRMDILTWLFLVDIHSRTIGVGHKSVPWRTVLLEKLTRDKREPFVGKYSKETGLINIIRDSLGRGIGMTLP